MGKKINVMVLYGGQSGEHEISLQSASSIIRNLDRNKYNVTPVAIDKSGKWLLNNTDLIAHLEDEKSVIDTTDGDQVILPPTNFSEESCLLSFDQKENIQKIDVVFPVMHGPRCEDGVIQGFLELANVPYVGSGVLGSAIGMDKIVSKKLVEMAGVPIVPYLYFRKHQIKKELVTIIQQIESQIKYPIFVKPVSLGSSVGISKVNNDEELKAALEKAVKFDQKVLVEEGIDAREIELAVLENIDESKLPIVSIPGEIIPSEEHGYYSYESKYLDENGASYFIPAKLNSEQISMVQKSASTVFGATECQGMARVDFFIDRKTDKLYFNELNTIPGFTSISMYPKLFEASGIAYSELLNLLIDLAIKKDKDQNDIQRDYKN